MTRTEPIVSTVAETTSYEFLTVRELGAMLKISPASVYRLVERRIIPFYRLPRKLRFRKADIDAYLWTHRVDVMN